MEPSTGWVSSCLGLSEDVVTVPEERLLDIVAEVAGGRGVDERAGG